ncbi:hypothetical protein Gotur_021998 [Gossypium turneri]
MERGMKNLSIDDREGRVLLVQIHDLPLGFYSEVMARQFGNFIGKFIKYDTKQESHGDSFCPVRLNHKRKEMQQGWDLSLRAPPRRASIDDSIWLREEGDGEFCGPNMGRQNLRSNLRVDKNKDNWQRINPVLRFNLEGLSSQQEFGEEGVGSALSLVLMEHDYEENPLEILEGKKRPRSENMNSKVSSPLNHVKNIVEDEDVETLQISATARRQVGQTP